MTMPPKDKISRLARVSRSFTPAAPVDDVDLFAGRPDQLMACVDALFQRGLHVAVYGERGVGKTSLANVVPKVISWADAPNVRAIRVDCHTNDTFSSIWRKVFLLLAHATGHSLEFEPYDDPEYVRIALEEFEGTNLVVIDEFDRVEDDEALTLLADTVKTLSDHSSRTTLMFVGVAASVDHLLGEHESIIRNIRQIPMPRMSSTEIAETLDQRFAMIGDLGTSDAAKARIIFAAEGLPHFAHLLGLHACQIAVQDDRSEVSVADVELAEGKAVQTHSMADEYRRATDSAQPGNLYHEVLLGCAYAPHDSLGFFRPRDVREPLSRITGRPMQIQQYQRHLNEFSGDVRQTLYKEGEPRRLAYRFRDPLFQPFVKMMARARGIVTAELAADLQRDQTAAMDLVIGSNLDADS